MVGFDSNSHELLVCKAKFLAVLTENQPLGYLKRLRENESPAPKTLDGLRVTPFWLTINYIRDGGWTFAQDAYDKLKVLEYVVPKGLYINENWKTAEILILHNVLDLHFSASIFTR